MKGDFAEAYEAGRQAYKERGSDGPSGVFISVIVAIAVLLIWQGRLPWYLAILSCLALALAYIFIRAILQRRKAQPPKE